jgi:multiple sugar transport system permease protein
MYKNKRLNKNQPLFFILPALFFIIIIQYIPVFWGILLSFRKINMYNLSEFYSAPFIGFNNFNDLIHPDSLYFHSIKNILFFVIITVPVSYILSLGFALFIKKEFILKPFFIWLILLPYITPDTVVYSMWRNMFSTYTGIINQVLLHFQIVNKNIPWLNGSLQMYPVIIAFVWKSVSFGTLILLSGLEGIPDYVYESASLDGAGFFRKFIFVTWPLLKQVTYAFFFVSVINSLYSFNQFVVMLSQYGFNLNAIVPSVLIHAQAFRGFNIGHASAMAVVLLFFVLGLSAFYFIFQDKNEEKIW